MSEFLQRDPTLDAYWRSVILFGRNVASYKFALGKALLDLAQAETTFIPLSDLALPFALKLAEHLKHNDKQATSSSSRFLDAVRAFNKEDMTENELRDATVKLGFNNVLDAFHIVNSEPIERSFFEKDFSGTHNGIVVTDDLLALKENVQFSNLPTEIEARWRLVETAWELQINQNLLQISTEESDSELLLTVLDGRVNVTSARDALNGYQKGHCFYCFSDIALEGAKEIIGDVDHFLPWALRRLGDPFSRKLLNGVWNLVLACQPCNRGAEGKFSRIPAKRFLKRLQRRNNYLIASHHPLRETLKRQTGRTVSERQRFLSDTYDLARPLLGSPWAPKEELKPVF